MAEEETKGMQFEGNPFEGDRLLKYLEQLESEISAPNKETPQETPCPEGTPCAEEAKKAKSEPKEGERQPYKVLKVDGKEVPVYSEEELIALAQQGVDYTKKRQRDAEWEKALREREELIERLAPHIEKLAAYIDSGGEFPFGKPQPKEEPPEETLEEEPIDPVAAKMFKELQQKLKKIEEENEMLKQQTQISFLEKAQKELTDTFNAVVKEIPFDQVSDGERNITQEIFSALVALKVNRDALRQRQDRNHKLKTIAEYFKEAAKDLNYLQNYFKGQSANGEITPEIIKQRYPKVAEALGKEAVDSYLKSLEEKGMPQPRPVKSESLSSQAKPKEFKSIDEAISLGLNDPEIAQALEEFGKNYLRR